MTPTLSPEQRLALEVPTRITSVLSVLGSTFIISTFLCFPFFRKPINRLVFFATFGNIMANIATLTSTSGIPRGNELSSLCEFQGTLIQWFMMADSLWVLCMALNVFLVFFSGYDSHQLRQLEKWYLILAYGIPAVPAITYVILDHTGRRVLGSATLWCWVSKEVDWMRIAFFYAPVWIVISIILAIYIVTGIRIFRKRALLRSFSRQSLQPNAARRADFPHTESSYVTTNKIVVTTQIKYDVTEQQSATALAMSDADQASISSYSSNKNLSPKHKHHTNGSLQCTDTAQRTQREHHCVGISEYSKQHGGISNGGYSATAFAANDTGGLGLAIPTPRSSAGQPLTRTRNTEGNAAALAYLKVAFLMFLALFVVWVPSTVNRLYQFIHKDQQNFGLNVISAVVLPLQGAWNAIIYIFTTRSECSRAYGLIMGRITGTTPLSRHKEDDYSKDSMTSSRGGRTLDGDIELEDILKQGRVYHTRL
ncbi:hypothetical protein ACN47E_006351 [Coniothyrium glycines]